MKALQGNPQRDREHSPPLPKAMADEASNHFTFMDRALSGIIYFIEGTLKACFHKGLKGK
ncbi:MAG: hypothetical protein JXN62_01240 [Bacteroidales bacterium]|nr:hypothetical protein [Bacteroidales bacterium]